MECELVTRLFLRVKSRTPAVPLRAQKGPTSRRSFQCISQDPFTSTDIANYLEVIVKHTKLRNWKRCTKQTGLAEKP